MRRRTARAGYAGAFFLPNTEDAVSRYHDINNALWAALEQGRYSRTSLLSSALKSCSLHFGVQGNPRRDQRYYYNTVISRADTFPGAEEAGELAEIKPRWLLFQRR